jgi:hypothetical protein
MKALQVRKPEDLAVLVVILADTYGLPLAKTATMAVDQIRSAGFQEDADQFGLPL